MLAMHQFGDEVTSDPAGRLHHHHAPLYPLVFDVEYRAIQTPRLDDLPGGGFDSRPVPGINRGAAQVTDLVAGRKTTHELGGHEQGGEPAVLH